MHLDHEIGRKSESLPVDSPFPGHGDILLVLGEDETIVGSHALIVIRVRRSQQDSSFEKPDLNSGFQEYAAGQILPRREFQDTSASGTDQVDRALDRPGIQGDAVRPYSESGRIIDLGSSTQRQKRQCQDNQE